MVNGTEVFLTVCDIADFEAVERAIGEANAAHGRATDHVVHAAIVSRAGYVWEQSSSQLQKDMGATYLGAVYLFKVRRLEYLSRYRTNMTYRMAENDTWRSLSGARPRSQRWSRATCAGGS